jgi:tetratricopeptide (TPR) repeat protein
MLNMHYEAIADFNRALAIDPSLATVYYNRALSFARLRHFEQAIDDYTSALSLDPALRAIYHDRGNAYFELKNYQKAIDDYSQGFELNPHDILLAYNRGCAYLALNEPLKAIEDFNHVITVLPNFACTYNNRGEAYLRLRNLAQARADCRRSWHLDSSHVDHGWMMQWIDMCMIQPEVGMAECLEHIAQAGPQDYSAYLCRGVAQWLRGNCTYALTEIERAITMEQEQWGAYFWRGVVYATLCRDEEAVASLQYALALNMPPVLLAPLQWIKHERPDFYAQYVLPLLKRN